MRLNLKEEAGLLRISVIKLNVALFPHHATLYCTFSVAPHTGASATRVFECVLMGDC